MTETTDYRPADFKDFAKGDGIRFLTRDTGRTGAGLFWRTGTVTQVTDKTVTVTCDGNQLGATARIRRADWVGRAPERAVKAPATTKRYRRTENGTTTYLTQAEGEAEIEQLREAYKRGEIRELFSGSAGTTHTTLTGLRIHMDLEDAPEPTDPAPALDRIAPPVALRFLADYVTDTSGEEPVQRITVTMEGDPVPVLDKELPYGPGRNAARTLEALGWTITGMETYGGPSMFRAWVTPSPLPRLMPDQARGIVNGTFPEAQDFQPAYTEAGEFLGYTWQSTPQSTARFGWITPSGTFARGLEAYRSGAEALLPMAVMDDERQARRRALAQESEGSRLARRATEAVARTAEYRARMDDRTAEEARRYGAPVPPLVAARIAAREAAPLALPAAGEAPAQQLPAPRVLEGVVVQHDGATDGCFPKHVQHPDVLAARGALDGMAFARLTDRHDISAPTEEEQQTRGYVVKPRGDGRVTVYWLERGKAIRRDTPLDGAALDCLEYRMKTRGWETERMGRSAHCLFAHVPQDQRQG
ncbi:hypothetical protein [Streptomyces sp. H27-H5]|uniref:hypothetical protein n=1 Tax=Streptomyces sp. H27-H5 TaxID=2996460 RepID=UPI00226F1038|nr:hypothetical protein [Streptomyces sp. H27-H5]MCY0957700.1 hypothetical protein [Streptomyces sp. H27-H5]